MGALPKQRVNKSAKGKRRSHLRIALPQLDTCPQCKSKKVSHHVCHVCGTYRGRQVLQVEEANAE